MNAVMWWRSLRRRTTTTPSLESGKCPLKFNYTRGRKLILLPQQRHQQQIHHVTRRVRSGKGVSANIIRFMLSDNVVAVDQVMLGSTFSQRWNYYNCVENAISEGKRKYKNSPAHVDRAKSCSFVLRRKPVWLHGGTLNFNEGVFAFNISLN